MSRLCLSDLFSFNLISHWRVICWFEGAELVGGGRGGRGGCIGSGGGSGSGGGGSGSSGGSGRQLFTTA